MTNQKKILDLKLDGKHLVCIQNVSDRYNPFHVYLVVSVTGAPVRKRLLIKYGDFMSVLYFLSDFYKYGLDAMPYCEMKEWIEAHTA